MGVARLTPDAHPAFVPFKEFPPCRIQGGSDFLGPLEFGPVLQQTGIAVHGIDRRIQPAHLMTGAVQLMRPGHGAGARVVIQMDPERLDVRAEKFYSVTVGLVVELLLVQAHALCGQSPAKLRKKR